MEVPQVRAVAECIAFSPAGNALAVCSLEDNLFGELAVWDLRSRSLLATTALRGSPSAVAYSPDGDTIAVANFSNDGHIIRLFNARTLRPVSKFKADIGGYTNQKIAFVSGDRIITLALSQITVWSTSDGRALQTAKGNFTMANGAWQNACCHKRSRRFDYGFVTT
jgi:WD40 repeat protein